MTPYRFFKMAAAAAQHYFRFRICWCRCLQKVKISKPNFVDISQFMSERLRYNHFRFGTTNVRHIGILFPVSILTTSPQSASYFASSCPISWFSSKSEHPLIEVIKKRIRCRNMTSYRFFKMAVAAAQYYFQFRICWRRDVTAFRKSKSISKPNFVNICQFVAEITTSVLEKQTSAILEFYFRFCFLPFHRNRRVIVHQPAEFPPNRTTHCGNMTSYQFFKTAAAAAQYYFRFSVCWCRCLEKVKIYLQTKFRRHTSIDGWDITNPGLEKQTSAILEFYFRFRSRSFHRNRRVILHRAAAFRSNRTTHCGNMTSYRYSTWQPSAMLYLLWVMAHAPTKCLSWSELSPQIVCSSD